MNQDSDVVLSGIGLGYLFLGSLDHKRSKKSQDQDIKKNLLVAAMQMLKSKT